MAKDDYYIIVCKILIFLYKKLKGIEKTANMDYIVPQTKDFPISEEYLYYVIEKMEEQKFVEKVKFVRAWGGDIISMDISNMRIRPEGIDHLRENSTMRKLVDLLPEAKAIISLFN